MLLRACVVSIAATLLCAAASSGAPAAEASGVRMSLSAGLAGAGRLGRWMPVDVDVENTGGDLDGIVVVAWGDARVEQLVTMGAPSRRTFHLFIRSGDVRDTVNATLRSNGRDPLTVSVPLHVVGDDETFTMCIAGATAGADDCSVALPVQSLPRTWRGYDTADRVLVSGASALDRDQRAAVALWRAIRTAEERGGGERPALTLAERGRWDVARTLLGGYAFALMLVALPAWRSRRVGAVAAVAVTAVTASIAAAASGRTAAAVIRHATVVTQFAGAAGALVDLRAAVDFSADGDYAITPSLADGAMNVGPGYGMPSPYRFNADGVPLLTGRFGLGARQAFQLEATAGPVLDVEQGGDLLRLTNVSPVVLRNCEFPAAWTPNVIATLAPRQSIELIRGAGDDQTVARCDVAGDLVAFSDPAHRLESVGTTTFMFDLAREGGAE